MRRPSLPFPPVSQRKPFVLLNTAFSIRIFFDLSAFQAKIVYDILYDCLKVAWERVCRSFPSSSEDQPCLIRRCPVRSRLKPPAAGRLPLSPSPDAGKTTLDRKALLFGRDSRTAGSVKASQERQTCHQRLDGYVEKQRGISVTSSAMQFEFDGYHINILDTPATMGFRRTPIACSSRRTAPRDAHRRAKGRRGQTIKVCSPGNIPIFTFVSQDGPRGQRLVLPDGGNGAGAGIRACPINWPIGTTTVTSRAFTTATHRW